MKIGWNCMWTLLFVAMIGMMSCSPDEKGYMEEKQPVPPSESGEGNEDYNNPNNEEDKMNRTIQIRIGEKVFSATLEDNETARAFVSRLPMTVTMTEMNGNEKYYTLPYSLPVDSYRPGTIYAGDLLLWGNNTVVLFYDRLSSPYSYTRLGKIDQAEGLETAVGYNDVEVTFELKNN